MMVVLSLARFGRKKRPFYHVIARNKTAKRDSAIEKIGYYDPLLPKEDNKNLKINLERFNYWTSVGAQPTLTVKNLFRLFTKRNNQETVKA
ncbi:MAG: 30S ribosomal protein S16 [Rickettsiales bacterium]